MNNLKMKMYKYMPYVLTFALVMLAVPTPTKW